MAAGDKKLDQENRKHGTISKDYLVTIIIFLDMNIKQWNQYISMITVFYNLIVYRIVGNKKAENRELFTKVKDTMIEADKFVVDVKRYVLEETK